MGTLWCLLKFKYIFFLICGSFHAQTALLKKHSPVIFSHGSKPSGLDFMHFKTTMVLIVLAYIIWTSLWLYRLFFVFSKGKVLQQIVVYRLCYSAGVRGQKECSENHLLGKLGRDSQSIGLSKQTTCLVTPDHKAHMARRIHRKHGRKVHSEAWQWPVMVINDSCRF